VIRRAEAWAQMGMAAQRSTTMLQCAPFQSLADALKDERMAPMSLQHLLWRLSEGKTRAFEISLRASCPWPSCDASDLALTMRLRPLCGRSLRIMAAGPVLH
jgi:hypothetical protein